MECGPCGLPELRHLPRRERLGVELAVAAPNGPWWTFGRVSVHDQLAPGEERALDLDPFHTSGALVPTGLLNRVRRPAYVGSRRGRPSGHSAGVAEAVRHGLDAGAAGPAGRTPVS